jgi:hypothetical protein
MSKHLILNWIGIKNALKLPSMVTINTMDINRQGRAGLEASDCKTKVVLLMSREHSRTIKF